MPRILLSICLCLAVANTMAQEYPARPIRIVVPFGPGGATDTPARLIAPKLGEALGQSVIIENRPGAGGIIGIDGVVKSAPDGYTLLMATNGELVMNPFIYSKLPYDPFKDLVPVSIMVESPLVMIVAPSSKFKSLADVIAAAKERPGEITYSSAGNGSTSNVLTEAFAQRAGIKLLHVPYKGGAPASTAVISGEVAFGFLNLGSASVLMNSGRAKGLAITSASRHPDYPSLPTVSEAGVRDFDDGIWVGLAAPAGVSPDIIRRINVEVTKVLHAPGMRARVAQLGLHSVASTPDQAAARIKREIPKYAEVIKQANIRAE